jgi:hypothetical protein
MKSFPLEKMLTLMKELFGAPDPQLMNYQLLFDQSIYDQFTTDHDQPLFDQFMYGQLLCLTNRKHMTDTLTCPITNDQL